jgi:hypothetical protein
MHTLLLAYCTGVSTYFVVADRLVKAEPALEVEPKLDWRFILPTLKTGTCCCSQAPKSVLPGSLRHLKAFNNTEHFYYAFNRGPGYETANTSLLATLWLPPHAVVQARNSAASICLSPMRSQVQRYRSLISGLVHL